MLTGFPCTQENLENNQFIFPGNVLEKILAVKMFTQNKKNPVNKYYAGKRKL